MHLVPCSATMPAAAPQVLSVLENSPRFFNPPRQSFPLFYSVTIYSVRTNEMMTQIKTLAAQMGARACYYTRPVLFSTSTRPLNCRLYLHLHKHLE